MVAISVDFKEADWKKNALSCLTAGVWLMRVPEERLGELGLLAIENGIALHHEQRRDGMWVCAATREHRGDVLDRSSVGSRRS